MSEPSATGVRTPLPRGHAGTACARDAGGDRLASSESAAYRELAERLAIEGVDLIALEMLEDTEHAARACEAARKTGLPIWLGVSCRLRASDSSAELADSSNSTSRLR